MLEALGKVVSYIPYPQNGYFKLTIRNQIPFDFKYLNFRLWIPWTTPLDYVAVSYTIQGDFNILHSLNPAVVHECINCASYCDGDDIMIDKIGCKKCDNLSSEKEHIRQQILNVLKIEATQYTVYEKCVSIQLSNATSRYQSIIRESEPLYQNIANLKLGPYQITGWANDRHLKISEISVPYLHC